MAGDTLARGAKSAQFPGPQVSQEKWDAVFGKKKRKKITPKRKTKLATPMGPGYERLD